VIAKPFTVLVIGGGIGGLALGQALRAAGVDVRIYERNRRAEDWVQGYRININPVGSRSLHHCLPTPLWEAFVATAGNPGSGIAFRTHRLTELLSVGRDVITAGADGPVGDQYAASRSVLRNLLLAGMDDVIRFDKTFLRYQNDADDRVTAFFADGTSATGDVLIGADGANSRVRQQYLPHAERVETDAVGIAGRLPLTAETLRWLPPGIAGGMNCILPPAGSFLFTAAFDGRRRTTEAIDAGRDLAALGVDPDALLDGLQDYVLWGFVAHRRDLPADVSALDAGGLKALVDRMIRRWHPVVRRMVADADPASVGLMRFKRSALVEAWPSTPVTVLGDAIHNMPPVMGLGGNMALRDAAELSTRLVAVHRGESDLVSAIAGYETRMREYGYGAVREATRYTEAAISGNPLPRLGMKAWLRLCRAVPAVRRSSFVPARMDDLPARREPSPR